MKRWTFWTVWALAPIVILALHLGAGQKLVAHDNAGRAVHAALKATDGKDWAAAAQAYGDAIAALPRIRRSHGALAAIAVSRYCRECGRGSVFCA